MAGRLDRLVGVLGKRYLDLVAGAALVAGAGFALIPGALVAVIYKPRESLLLDDLLSVAAALIAVGVGVVVARRANSGLLGRWLADKAPTGIDVLRASYASQRAYHRAAVVVAAPVVVPGTIVAFGTAIHANAWQILAMGMASAGMGVWALMLSWTFANVALAPVRRRLVDSLPPGASPDAPRPLSLLLQTVSRRAGDRLPIALGVVSLLCVIALAPVCAGVATMFFHVSTGDGVAVAAIAAGVATVSGGVGMLAAIPASQPLRAWLAGDRSDGAASEAWEVAVDLPWLYQRAGWRIAPFAVAVGAIAIGGVLHINATATLALFVGGLGVGVVGNVVALLAMDAILAPVRGDIGAHLGPEVLEATPRLPIGARLISSMIAAQLAVCIITAVAVGGGLDVTVLLGLSIGVIAVVTPLGIMLASLASASVAGPVKDLARAADRVAAGDLTVRLPLVNNDEIADLTVRFNAMVAGLAERQRLHEAFGTYVHPHIARRVLEAGATLDGEELDATAMFVDIRGFTSIAETLSPRAAVALLNEFFDIAGAVVGHCGGHVNRYLGDGLLAVFGAPLAAEGHADRALEAACDLVEAVARSWSGRVRVGVGLSSGPMLAGSIGGSGHLEYTVIGDTVNVASRLESLTKETGDNILLSQMTRDRLRTLSDQVESRGVTELRGRGQPITVYTPRRRS